MEMFATIFNALIPYWSFLAVLTILTFASEILERHVFPRPKSATDKMQWILHRALPFMPIAAGAIVGLFWPDPLPGMTGRMPAIMYFAFAGALSNIVWPFAVSFAKKAHVDLSIPGDDAAPEAAPKKSE